MVVKNKRRLKSRFVKISTNTWEYSDHRKFDATITKDGKKYYLDVFNSKIQDNEEAHIYSDVFDSYKEARETFIDMYFSGNF